MTAAAEMPEEVLKAAREVVAEFYSEQSAHEEVERILAGMRDHWSEIRVACRAILSDRQRDQWQPIDTAPKDGSDILLGFAGQDRPAVVAGWFGEPGWEEYDSCNTVKGRPTHWQPLPAAPKAEG